jgi:FkbM family methyltransferase
MNNNYLVNYSQIFIPFYDVITNSGIDNAIRLGFPIEQIIREYTVFKNIIKFGDIVYDIGAYTGTHSIFFTLLGAKVFSFEPSPFNYYRLVKNIKPFCNIFSYDIAFHDKNYDIFTPFKDCNASSPLDLNKEQQIKYRIFDSFCLSNNLPEPDFMKIDIEGMETIFLKTIIELIKREKCSFYIELHPLPRFKEKLGHYENNPTWLHPEEGGYDFNEFKKYNYKFYRSVDSERFVEFDKDIDFNTLNGAIILIPSNKNIKI